MRVLTLPVGDPEVVVREWGSSTGRPLLFWHGLNPFGALQLNEAGPAWAARGFRVLAVAAPGIADSPALADPADYRPTRLADLVVSLADSVGLETFAYVGWSWGALIGVHLAVNHADRLEALVLLDAGHVDTPGDPARTLDDVLAEMDGQQARYSFASWDEFLEAVRPSRPTWRPALEEQVRAGMRQEGDVIVPRSDPRAAAAAAHGLVAEQPSSTHAALGELDLPILLVLATPSDTPGEAETFRRAVPRADIATIESGHDLLADAPAETIGLVGDWLEMH